MIDSPFFVENLKKLPPDVLGVAPLEGIEYHLSRSVPKGSVVCVLYPKGILEEVLPRVAKERNLKVLLVGGSVELRSILASQGSLESKDVPIDLFLTEPSAFGKDGAWVRPGEAEAFANRDVIGVGSVLQWRSYSPKECDLVRLKSVVSEKGVFSPEHFDQEVRFILPWRVS